MSKSGKARGIEYTKRKTQHQMGDNFKFIIEPWQI